LHNFFNYLVTSALGPTAYGKTWFPYDCKITQNGNSYDKICNYKEVEQSQLGYHRQQLGPEISPYSPIQTIPFGYQACSGSSSITNKNGVFYSATVTENLCYRPGCNGCGTWFQTGSSTYRRTVTGG